MGIFIDIFIVLIVVFFAYRGYKKGIVNVGIKLFSVAVSLIVSIFLCGPITHLVISNTEIDEKIEQTIIEKFSPAKEEKSSQSDGIDGYIQNQAKNMVNDAQNAVAQSTARQISVNLVKAGVIILLFIILRIGFLILQVFTDILTKIPIIKECNEIAGIAYGMIKAVIIIYVILFVLLYICSVTGSTELNNMIESSYITKFFSNLLKYR